MYFNLPDLDSKSLKLLLVDDERDIVDVMKRGLELQGIKVDGFTDGNTALDHYKPDYYDRIIADIRMPSRSGFEFARAIWDKDPEAQICFFTSFEILQEEAKKVFTKLRSDCFIKKPISPKELAEHIKSHKKRQIDSVASQN